MPRKGKGRAWEEVCDNSRDAMQQDGIAHWIRLYPPILKVGEGKKNRKGSFLAVYTGKGPPDWILLHNNLSILGDDKDCKKSPWGSYQLKKHQAEAFNKHEKQGGLACVLLRMPDRSRWIIPWKILKPLWATREKLDLQKLNEIGAFQWQKNPKFPKRPNYDWLTPLLDWYNQEVEL